MMVTVRTGPAGLIVRRYWRRINDKVRKIRHWRSGSKARRQLPRSEQQDEVSIGLSLQRGVFDVPPADARKKVQEQEDEDDE
jgi:hypothetical protein